MRCLSGPAKNRLGTSMQAHVSVCRLCTYYRIATKPSSPGVPSVQRTHSDGYECVYLIYADYGWKEICCFKCLLCVRLLGFH